MKSEILFPSVPSFPVSALALFLSFATLPACNLLSGSARSEKPVASSPAAAEAPAAAAALDLQWERGAERLKPVTSEKGELVFKDELVVAENAFLILSKWGSATVQSVVVSHEAQDARGELAVESSEVPVTHDPIGDRWRLRLEAFLVEGLQARVGELVHRLTLVVQDSNGNRGQFVVRFRVRGAEAGELTATSVERVDAATITRAGVEAGTAFIKRVTLRNPYPTSLTIWVPNTQPVTLVQKMNLHVLRQGANSPAYPAEETYLSRASLEIVPRMQNAEGHPLEERMIPGQPRAWFLPAGETATLNWQLVAAGSGCTLPAPTPQRLEWTVLERQCKFGPFNIQRCEDVRVPRSASTTMEWTRVTASLLGETLLTWDSTWSEEFSPRHLKQPTPQKLTGSELTAQYAMPCQGLH